MRGKKEGLKGDPAGRPYSLNYGDWGRGRGGVFCKGKGRRPLAPSPTHLFPLVLFEEKAGQGRPIRHFQKWVGPAVPGLGEEDGSDPVVGQKQAGFQAILHEEPDLLVPKVMEFAVGITGGHHPDILGRHLR